MIEGLDKVLEGSGQPGIAELRGRLQELLGGRDSSGRFMEQQTLKPGGRRVFRLRFAMEGRTRSMIVKRLRPGIARRNELVSKRWLPAIGLGNAGPRVLESIAECSAACVWHVYEDLGSWELDPADPGREQVQSAVELIARVHTRFAGHALLGEVRLEGGDLGIHFYDSSVRDAIHGLEAWHPAGADRGTRDRLLDRLERLRAELPSRREALSGWDQLETLLHGDLWAENVFVIPAAGGWSARLIDWDHAAVGPASYDLSTFLLRFSTRDRLWVLDLYRKAVAAAGWRLPGERELNRVFETHEYARFANRIIWPAIALAMEGAPWGAERLREVEGWFHDFEAVLPVAPEVEV